MNDRDNPEPEFLLNLRRELGPKWTVTREYFDYGYIGLYRITHYPGIVDHITTVEGDPVEIANALKAFLESQKTL